LAEFDLVVFDNDGVLVSSEGIANEVLAGLLDAYGWPLGVDGCVERFKGSTLGRVRTMAEAHLGRALPASFEADYHARLFEGFRSGLRAVDGVAEALDAISVPVCVASSGTRERIRLALELTGLLDRFDGRIFSAEDVDRGKPAPDLFLHAAREMGAEPRRCAVVEDSALGVEAARAAGMTAFGYRVEADVTITDMRELPSVLSSEPLGGPSAPAANP
jgi:HAD superfamily hydrolase (TIGR01509 family)